MRQHVNPLSSFFQLPRELPSPETLFEHPYLPIHLDIGSARGNFLLSLAPLQPDWNHLGLEIRRPLVYTAEKTRKNLKIENLRFLFCNANISLKSWMLSLPKDRLQRVSIQFPDPWFKRRHKKRRVLQPSLLIGLANALQPCHKLFIQSDVFAIIQPMTSLVDLSCCFDRCEDVNGFWLEKSPFPIASEREAYVCSKGLQVYRALYTRNNQPIPKLSDLEIEHNRLNQQE